VGDSFVKQSFRDNCYYGQLYKHRKAIEVAKNNNGDFAAQADASLGSGKNLSAAQKATYKLGKLPDGRLDLRARRWAVKLFLAHLHDVMYRDFYGTEPPLPYPIAHMGHTDYIPPPPG
jgi:hypothetical protein